MDIVGSVLGAVTGGLFGLVGNLAAKVAGYLEQKQAFTQKQAEWVHETDLLQLQMQARAAETEQEIKLAESQGSGLAAAPGAESTSGASYPWVNAVRALTRPALTLGLAGFLGCAVFALPPGEADRVADSLVFAAVTAIVWWFGDRAPRKTVDGQTLSNSATG